CALAISQRTGLPPTVLVHLREGGRSGFRISRGLLNAARQRGRRQMVISDDRAGLRKAIADVFTRRRGSAATCTSCGTHWTTCRPKRATALTELHGALP